MRVDNKLGVCPKPLPETVESESRIQTRAPVAVPDTEVKVMEQVKKGTPQQVRCRAEHKTPSTSGIRPEVCPGVSSEIPPRSFVPGFPQMLECLQELLVNVLQNRL